MKSILVSACLLGVPCRYDGAAKPCAAVCSLKDRYRLIPVCPEVLGGLSTPRTPSEIVGERVRMRDGRDVTESFRYGAEEALRIARENDCHVAVLKERSPSCGFGEIYSGGFDGTLVPGNGVCAALLASNGIRILGERAIDQLEFVTMEES